MLVREIDPILLFIASAVMVLLFTSFFFALRSMQQKQKALGLLQKQKEETERQKQMLEQALSDLSATQAQLIHREKMASLGELTAGIAHELQNPLNFVKNFSEVSTELAHELDQELSSGKAGNAQSMTASIRDNLRMITFHSNRASSIIKNMMLHSHASNGRREPADIGVLIEEYLRLSYHGVKAKERNFEVRLMTEFDPAVEKVPLVPEDIGRVLLNLFANAFYAVGEKKKRLGESYQPTVWVKTKKHRGRVEVSVRDNGTGIPPSIREKILQPFFTTKPTGVGTGLGLSLSYDVIRAHGGEIQVESGEGEYAEFRFFLPLN